MYLTQLFSKTIKSIIEKRFLSFPCNIFYGLHPYSFYRCLSHICWSQNLSQSNGTLSNTDKDEIESIKKLYGLFPKDLLHQYLPIIIQPEDVTKFNTSYIRSISKKMGIQKRNLSMFINYLKKTNQNKKNDSVNSIDGSLLMPFDKALGLDGMHNLYNACLKFIKLLNQKPKVIKAFDLSVNTVLFGNRNEKHVAWSFYPNFKKVKAMAKERETELMNQGLPYLDEDLLNKSSFELASDYKGIMFLCSYYHYLFKDNMKIPFIFFYKILLDYLVYFCNVNFDIESIVKHQLNYNIFLGLLQNEVAPTVSKISLHYACHYADTILNTGDIASSNCFKAENSYRRFKVNKIPCKNTILNMSRRTLAQKSAMLIKKRVEDGEKEQAPSLSKELTEGIIHTNTLILKIGKCNLYDELMYYQDSSFSHITILDLLINKDISEWETIVDNYINDNKINFQLKQMKYQYYEKMDNINLDLFQIKLKNRRLDDSNLAFTRINNGNLLVFYIFGEVEFEIDNEVYDNYLCLNVPVTSGSSCIITSLYSFLDLENFENRKHDIFLISKKRLVTDHIVTMKDGDRTSFFTNKLFIREYRRLKKCSLYTKLLKSIE